MNFPKLVAIAILLIGCISAASAQRFWVASTASNWNNTANWSTTSGGPGGASVPSPADVVTFNATRNGNCTIDIPVTIAGITVNGYTGIIDLNGFDLATIGANTFTTGTINNSGIIGSLILNTTGSTTFNGSLINANVSGTTGRIFFNGSTFNGSVNVTKTDTNNDNSTGNNVFNGTTTITNATTGNGTGQILLGNGNPDQFNGLTTFNNNGSFRIYFANNHPGQVTSFSQDVILNSNKSGGTDNWSYLIADGANTRVSFGGNLTINCGGILQSNHRILNGTGSQATFSGSVNINLTNTNAGTVIQMGTAGTSTYNGNIVVSNIGGASGVSFNVNTTANSVLAATRTITLGVGGFTSGTLSLPRFTQVGATAQNLSTFSGTATLTVGPSSQFDGDVIFIAPQINLNGTSYNGSATIEKTGATGNTGTGANIFSGVTNITNSGSGVLRTNGGNVFNGTTTITNSGSADVLLDLTSGSTYNGNVTFTNSGTSSIRVGYTGTNIFNGDIIVNSISGTGILFCETATATASLTSGTISIGGSGFSTGSLSLPRFTQSAAVDQTLTSFTGTASLILGPFSAFTGNVNFASPQLFLNGCTFNGTAALEKNGATDNASTGGNVFNGTTTITNSGSGYLLTGNGTFDQFNANTTFNNTGSYRIYFAHNHPGQTTTFASDLILNASKSGGADAWAYQIAENGTSGLSIGGNLTINCAGSVQSNFRFLNGTGSSATIGGATSITISNTSTATSILMGQNGTTTYNGNISVSNTGGAAGITFNTNTSASSTLNGSITSAGFTSGSLNLFRFTQVGAIPQTLTLTNNGTLLQVGPNSQFDGDVTFISPRLLLNGATYNGTTYLEKNGNTDDVGTGGNVFVGIATIVNSGSGYLLTANNSPDIFNNDVAINNTGSNYIYLAHNVAGNQFNGNITLSSSGSSLGIRFSNNATGFSTFSAGATNKISIGAGGYNVGELRLRRFTQTGTSSQAVTLTGSAQLYVGPTSQFDADVTFVSPRLFLNGTTFNGITYLEKNGASNDDGTGGNIFNQLATLVNSGSAYLLTASSSPDTFNNKLIILNSGSSTIRLSDNASGNVFAGNIEVNSTFGGGIYFGNQALGTSTLTAGNTISVGTTGVISGDIRLIRFTQVGSTAQTLDLSGIAILTLGPSSTFDGNVDFRAPQVLLNGTIYNGVTYLEKKGATDNVGTGGNTFNAATTLVNSGSGYLLTANASPDIFASTLTVTNTGSNIIYLAHNVAGSQFNGNITFNSTLGSQGIYFANNTTGNATLGTGASLSVGGLGFSSGELRFRRFTQIGNTNQTLLLTGTGLIRIGPSSTFNGVLDFRAPRLALDGCIYNGTTYLEKTGASTDNSSGGNVFNGVITLANSGSGIFTSANSILDTFNADLTLTNTGTASIRMADNIPGTVFNGNIAVNSTNTTSGSGIYFSNNVATANATLAAGRTISVGATGFTAGELRLIRFTQLGATAQTLTLTGTAILQLGTSSTFNGDVNFRSPQLIINSTIFNRSAYLEKTGATNNTGAGGATFANGFTATIVNSGSGQLRTNGGHTFNGTTTLLNSGTADFLLELTTPSTYNGDVTMTNTGASNIRAAYIGANSFNGNITVNSSAGNGIYFCENAAGTATLASGRTISVGSGFSAGELRLQRFTQSGTTSQNIALTSSATFRSGPLAIWNGPLTVSAPIVFLDGTMLNGTTNLITKTGSSTDSSVGGNIFGGTSTFTNSGTGVFRFANTTADDFTGNVIFNQTSGTIQPAYNIASTFRGDVTVNGSTAITFGANNGTITFAGGSSQAINRSGSASPIFRRLLMNKSAGAVTLNTSASVTTSATFTTGILNTTSTNILSFANGSTSSGGSNNSHIDGPVTKIGNAAFGFPVGDAGLFRPITISAPATATDSYTAEYFKAAHPYGGVATYAPGIVKVSTCEYWLLNRNVGSSAVNTTLSWNGSDCTVNDYITDLPTLLVTRWNGTNWINLGNASTTGSASTGTVTSSTTNTFSLNPSPITLASTSTLNPLPIQLIDFTAQTFGDKVQLNWATASEFNNHYFTVQRSSDGIEFEKVGEVMGAGTTTLEKQYQLIDLTPKSGISYYRLKQTDFDGKFTFSHVVSVDMEDKSGFAITPNFGKSGFNAVLSQSNDYIVSNSTGVVLIKILGSNNLDTSSLLPGVYFVRNGSGKTQRIIVY